MCAITALGACAKKLHVVEKLGNGILWHSFDGQTSGLAGGGELLPKEMTG
jgi:hypothetical protein